MLSSSFSALAYVLPTQLAFASSSSTGIVIPMYTDPLNYSTTPPTFVWQPVIDAKTSHPSVPFFVVVNPSNGPGNPPGGLTGCSYDPTYTDGNRTRDYQNGIGNLTNSGVVVLGYVFTKNGLRPDTLVKTDINDWISCYPKIKGIFLDEMPHVLGSGFASYYQNLTNYIHSKGLKYSYGNPGTDVDQAYQGLLDMMNICEGDNQTSDGSCPQTNSTLQGTDINTGLTNYWHTKYDKSTYSFLLYNQSPPLSQRIVKAMSVYVGLMYITDGDSSWTKSPSYLNNLASYLDNQSVLSTINSKDTSNNPLGATVVITQSGNQVHSATTPFTYNETSGWQFVLNAQSLTGYTFCNWSDGVNTYSNPIMISPTQSTTYTATYKVGITCP